MVCLAINGYVDEPNLEQSNRAWFDWLPEDLQESIWSDIAYRIDAHEGIDFEAVYPLNSNLPDDFDDMFSEFEAYVYDYVRNLIQTHHLNIRKIHLTEYVESETMKPEEAEYYIGIINPIREDTIGYDYEAITDIDLESLYNDYFMRDL